VKPRGEKYGAYSEMGVILDAVRDPVTDAGIAVHGRYPWLPLETVDAFVAEAGKLLARDQVAEAERLAHGFILTAVRSQPEQEPLPGKRREDLIAAIVVVLLVAMLIAAVVISR